MGLDIYAGTLTRYYYHKWKTVVQQWAEEMCIRDSFSALEIPKEFQDIAVEFYDLIMENDHRAALLGCRGNYDIAIQIDRCV